MRSQLAGLRVLVLPSGALVGPRIVLNGIAGEIQVYNAADALFAFVDPDLGIGAVAGDAYARLTLDSGSPLLLLNTGDVDEDSPPRVGSDVAGAAGARNLVTDLSSGSFDPFVLNSSAGLALWSASQDATEASAVVASATDIQLNVAGGGGAPNTSNTLPRGLVTGGLQRLVANDAARAAGANTDMTLTPTVIAGRTYAVHLHSQLSFGTAAAVYALGFTVDGVATGRFDRWTAADTAAGSTTGHTSSTIFWTPAASGTPTIRVVNDAGSGGTVTLTAAAGNPRTLTVSDQGIP